MPSRSIRVDELSAEERVKLMGELWDSLDPVMAAPITDSLAVELDRREAEADADPESGDSWDAVKKDLTKKLK